MPVCQNTECKAAGACGIWAKVVKWKGKLVCEACAEEGEEELELEFWVSNYECTFDWVSVYADEEIEEGFILSCQAHPTSPEIAIDYDDV